MANLTRKWIGSPNYSGRYGSSVRLVVIHSSEGAQDYTSLGNFFANPNSAVSSHTGIDNASGWTIGEYVSRGNSAWTAANANPVAVQTELCTPSGASANWSRSTWLSKDNMLNKCAQWVKEECQKYGIPIKELTASQAQGSSRGVCQHQDLGSWGGGHVNCGPGFPMDEIIRRALGGSSSNVEEEYTDMIQLQWTSGKAASVSIPNYFADGKGRLRLTCNSDCTVRCDWADPDVEAATTSVDLGYAKPNGFEIPKNANMAVLHLDAGEPDALVALSFSHT